MIARCSKNKEKTSAVVLWIGTMYWYRINMSNKIIKKEM